MTISWVNIIAHLNRANVQFFQTSLQSRCSLYYRGDADRWEKWKSWRKISRASMHVVLCGRTRLAHFIADVWHRGDLASHRFLSTTEARISILFWRAFTIRILFQLKTKKIYIFNRCYIFCSKLIITFVALHSEQVAFSKRKSFNYNFMDKQVRSYFIWKASIF